jgi:hypothetical protein
LAPGELPSGSQEAQEAPADHSPGAIIPQPGEGCFHYDFSIPSDSNEPRPPGWFGGWVGGAENFRPGIDWNDVIVSVERLEIWWWHPAYFGIFRRWDVGPDNISIMTEPGATAVEATTGSPEDRLRLALIESSIAGLGPRPER